MAQLQQNNLKLDIQTIDVKMNDYLQRKVDQFLYKLQSIIKDINHIDIYMKKNEYGNNPYTLVVRFGIPGADVSATDSGHRWKIIIKNVEKRLIRQLEKRKALLKNGH
jgi:ribosome-associated translation inhibitor RaiA